MKPQLLGSPRDSTESWRGKLDVVRVGASLAGLQILFQAEEMVTPTRRLTRVAFVGLLEATMREAKHRAGNTLMHKPVSPTSPATSLGGKIA